MAGGGCATPRGGRAAVRGVRLVLLFGLIAATAWLAMPVPAPAPMGAAAAAAPAAIAQVGGGSIRVPILAYHAVDYSGDAYSVTPEQLDEQCRWLVANGYTTVTFGQFWEANLGLATLPANPVVLTNDDGWPSAFAFADVLARYGMVGTYFVNNLSPLPPEQLLALAQRGPVEAHTVSHASLVGMGYEGQFGEIAQNKAYLEQITGQPVRFLAWPFGESDATAVEAAAAAGIAAAAGLGGTAAILGGVDPYHVPRIMIEVGDDLDTFAAKVGWW